MIHEKKCALVCALDINEAHLLQNSYDAYVAVDRGFTHLQKIGISPTLCLGDFDSLGFIPSYDAIKTFPADKDESDFALALQWALDEGFTYIVAYGVLGGRFDHTYAAQQEMAHAAEQGAFIRAIGNNHQEIFLSGNTQLSCKLMFPGKEDKIFSLFALTDEVSGVNISGAKWNLENATLRNTQALGLSNIALDMQVDISIKSGIALVFAPIA
ncbi:MAG: thiamine diphosphokinase [Eggerthellaceae bacterium]|nr:thiamine diphosphokinase [Eggerthellaceae bacterium]